MPMNFYSQSHQKLSSALRLGAMLGLSALISVAISSEVAAADGEIESATINGFIDC